MSNFKNINSTELQNMQSDSGITLIDVRTDAEVANGIIEGAVHIPLHLVPNKLQELDSAKPVVFYCQSGGRSAQASAFLAGKGFEQVYNLKGGISAWKTEGLPISKLR